MINLHSVKMVCLALQQMLCTEQQQQQQHDLTYSHVNLLRVVRPKQASCPGQKGYDVSSRRRGSFTAAVSGSSRN